MDFAGKGIPLSEAGVMAAAAAAGVELPELLSVVAVETAGCGFLPDRRPQLRFERHYFSRLTQGRHDATQPDVSAPSAGGYGAAGPHQYDRLATAAALDRTAALQSASWGLGQIMGANFAAAGYSDVEAMAADMVLSEDAQLTAMAHFVKSAGLDRPLAAHDWAAFARRYNGPGYAANQYDRKLADAYARLSSGSLPDFTARAAQIYLAYRGLLEMAGIDGSVGPRTIAAANAFRRNIGEPQTGTIDDALVAKLAA